MFTGRYLVQSKRRKYDRRIARALDRFVRYTMYTTGTPPRAFSLLLLFVASRAISLRYAVLSTSSYTLQRLAADCGSEGHRFALLRLQIRHAPVWGSADHHLIDAVPFQVVAH